jgi:hypothetical protein
MPKNKSKRQGSKAATGGADDDFDRMLAEVTAEDSELHVTADVPASTATTTNFTSSSTSSSSVRSGPALLSGLHISENAIVGACIRDDRHCSTSAMGAAMRSCE